MPDLADTIRRVLPTSGPGYTDHPEVDIKTHRSIAKWLQRLGIAIGIIALYNGRVAGSVFPMIVLLVFAGVSIWGAIELRLEALEWEVELRNE